LKAIDLVLGEGWTTKAKVARELFNDPQKDIEIEISFKTAVSVPSNNNYPDTQVQNIKLTMSLNPELKAKTTINNGQTFYGQETFKKLCHFIYIPSERNLRSELRVSQWTMLGKLMRLVYENYISHYEDDEENLKKEFKEKMSPAKNFLENDFSEGKVTFKKFVDKFKEKCRYNSSGLANDFDPVLDIYNLNWFYKTLQIHVKEDLPERHFDCEEVGAGMQNLLMISIFQTYSELMEGKVIFGIEEPEIYLYPQAQRSLYKSFQNLSENSQIFYTTHNPNFVDASRADDIFLLRKNTEKGTYKLEKQDYFTTFNANKDELKYKIYTHFNPERNELFFAKKVLFVEGDSDKILFSTLCEKKWNIDLDQNGVSIISCSGKAGVNYFLGVCKLIGFEDYFAVWDKDPKDESYQPDKDFLPETLEGDKGLELDPNLEGFLGLPSNNKEKVKNAHNWALEIQTNQIPNDFEKIRNFLGKETANEEVDEEVARTDISINDLPF
jgi:predicted ATP-dependent endonuclease of OLD family